MDALIYASSNSVDIVKAILGIITFFIGTALVIVLPLVLFLGPIFGWAIWTASKAKKLENSLKAYCAKNNIQLLLSLPSLPDCCKGFKLFQKGCHHQYGAVMKGNMNGIDYLCMNYIYDDYKEVVKDYGPGKKVHFMGMDMTIGGGKSVTTYGKSKNQTPEENLVCIFQLEGLDMPNFFIRDESMFDGIGKLFGGQDINFVEDRVFSGKFVLQGVDENNIRRFFDRKIRDIFAKEHEKGYIYEGQGDCLVILKKCSMFSDVETRVNMLERGINLMSQISENENNRGLLG